MPPSKHTDTLISLKEADLALREKLVASGELWDGYRPEMEALHNKNADALSEIMDQIGFPTIDKVGEEGYKAAWLIIQHAISKPNFMRRCALLLQEAVQEENAQTIHLAYLSDRIATFEGKAQLYGTQFDWDEHGNLSPQEYDDLTKVNERRKQIGLNTLEEQTSIIRQQAKKENQHPPKDFFERKKQQLKWLRKVGWR